MGSKWKDRYRHVFVRPENTRAPARTYDPLIIALFSKLPPPGSVWPKSQRELWLRIVELGFDLLYSKSEIALDATHIDAQSRATPGDLAGYAQTEISAEKIGVQDVAEPPAQPDAGRDGVIERSVKAMEIAAKIIDYLYNDRTGFAGPGSPIQCIGELRHCVRALKSAAPAEEPK